MRVAVVGVGLIGGSIALAAAQRAQATVAGFDLAAAALQQARERGALHHAADSIAEAVSEAQAVFVAVPVGALEQACAEALAHAPADCVVTDVGSTKRSVVCGREDPRFVGGHPLAGAETAGVEHARADLFEGATWYLTPAERTSGLLYERLHRLLHSFGARPCAIDPETHDRILATVSHLPHVLANVLVSQAARGLGDAAEPVPATGPSFRDATRVAGAPSAIWTDIYLANGDALGAQIDAAVAELTRVREALAAQDREQIQAWNEAAGRDRERLSARGLTLGPQVELRASVPNRPGVMAQLALELGRAGINIADLALYPAPDMSEGVVALWVGGEEAAGQAEQLIASLGFPVARA